MENNSLPSRNDHLSLDQTIWDYSSVDDLKKRLIHGGGLLNMLNSNMSESVPSEQVDLLLTNDDACYLETLFKVETRRARVMAYKILETFDSWTTLASFSAASRLTRTFVSDTFPALFQTGIARYIAQSLYNGDTQRALYIDQLFDMTPVRQRARTIERFDKTVPIRWYMPIIWDNSRYLVHYRYQDVENAGSFIELIGRIRSTQPSWKFPEYPSTETLQSMNGMVGFPYNNYLATAGTRTERTSRHADLSAKLSELLARFSIRMNSFAAVLKKSRAVIAGSAVLNIVTETFVKPCNWKPDDIDVFICGDITPLLEFFASTGSIEFSFYGKKFIPYASRNLRVTRLRLNNRLSIDLVECDIQSSPHFYSLRKFDFDFCGWLWDGELFVGPEGVEQMKGRCLMPPAPHRLEKYKSRGYDIQPFDGSNTAAAPVLVVAPDAEYKISFNVGETDAPRLARTSNAK